MKELMLKGMPVLFRILFIFFLFMILTCSEPQAGKTTAASNTPYLVVLGIAQDGGVPQAGTKQHPGWENKAFRRQVVCLAVVDPVSNERYLFEATPDLREQLYSLDKIAPASDRPGLNGIFLTHAHIGHYTGLMFLGFESMGAKGVPVFAMPEMFDYLSANGPWEQLVRYKNISLNRLENAVEVKLNERLRVTPFLVPHRQEFSEVVGYRIDGPTRSVLFIPDIDSWEEWDAWGTRIEEMIAAVDIAYLDGSFFANGEIPGRDMSGFPHPFISHSMKRFAKLPVKERQKVRFIHLNHSNPALNHGSKASLEIEKNGFGVAEEGERVGL